MSARCFTILIALLFTTGGVAAEPVDFNRDVKPILSDRCFKCHGPDAAERKAELRLDTEEGAYEWAVVPNDVAGSELISRVTSDDPEMRMPPTKGKWLSPQQIDILKRWVAQGAEYDEHWAYVSPTRPEPPSVGNEAWPRNAIDRFTLSKLSEHGLQPAEEANRDTLIRRASLALTGLPPTLEEVDAFVNDQRSDAYERLVDRLLNSPAYGERWASVWLDLARYADSAGYADDPLRTIWGYRDYVIRSFQENKPFDQFTIEQLAGDLLNNPTDAQLVATAFHRNTLTNSEGGTDDEEFRNVAVVDRANTTMSVWMGTTMACAQCHDHKYDPLSQQEYFEFFAFFNNTADADKRDESPTIPLWGDDRLEKKAALEANLAEAKKGLATERESAANRQAEWERELRENPAAATSPVGNVVRVDIPGRKAMLSLAEVQVFVDGKNVASDGAAAQSSTGFNGPAKLAIDGNTNGDFNAAKSTTHTNNEQTPWWEVTLKQPVPIEKIVIWNRTDNGLHTRLSEFRIVIRDEKDAVVWSQDVKESPNPSVEFETTTPPANIRTIAGLTAEERSDAQKKTLADYYQQVDPQLAKRAAEVRGLQKQLKGIKPMTTVPVLRELADDKRRETHIQIRGSFMDKSDQVHEGIPAAFGSLPKEAPKNRLELARWIVSRDNPLAARVTVNRFWEELFGKGLVITAEDFGSQGEQPSHPELLDWLAVEFIESGWDVRHMLRLMVTSATYRQRSEVTEELLRADPFNRLLSRGPRFRIPAETVRDQALAVSGLLSEKMYGPPAHPPRPKLNLKAAFGGTTDWTDSTGEDRYRRAIYTELRRSMPYPAMTTFDAPNREVCTVTRGRTNTPLQAFVTLNGVVYVEAAQALARRMVSEVESENPRASATHGFRLCLARPPSETEVDRLVALYEKAVVHFRSHEAEAMTLATDPLGPLPEGMQPVELAAWTTVANVLLNLDEMFLKP